MGASKPPRRPEPPADDAYLPLPALAAYSGMSVRTLRSYVHRSTHPIPYYRMDGKILVKRSEFDAWMQHFHVEGDHDLGAMVDDVMEELAR